MTAKVKAVFPLFIDTQMKLVTPVGITIARMIPVMVKASPSKKRMSNRPCPKWHEDM